MIPFPQAVAMILGGLILVLQAFKDHTVGRYAKEHMGYQPTWTDVLGTAFRGFIGGFLLASPFWVGIR